MELRTRQTYTDPRLKQSQQDLERLLLELESVVHPELLQVNTGKSSSQSLRLLVETIRQKSKEVESLIPQERDPSKREIYRKKLEDSNSRLQELELETRHSKLRRERDELGLNMREIDPESLNDISSAIAEQESLQHSSRAADEILKVGREILENLGSQSEIIRRTTNKIESIASSLGISSSVLRAVRRRQWGDAMIVYGGMITITVTLFLFYRWIHF